MSVTLIEFTDEQKAEIDRLAAERVEPNCALESIQNATFMIQLLEYEPHKATAAMCSASRGHDTRKVSF